MDRLAPFDVQIKHIAGKHLNLTDNLSRNSISNPEPIENYDEQLHNPLLEFNNNHGSILDEKESRVRTDRTNSHQTNSQSDSRHVLKLQTSDNKEQHRSSFLQQQNSVHTYQYKDKYIQNKETDLKSIEMIEKHDPSMKH